MKNALTIFRREVSAYFTSPIGYIFMIVFVLISVGLFTTSFFTFPVADMRPFFGNLPLLLCVFIPAVTMRVWAEERKENTWEMLLTFPMRSWELVVGKFFACFLFYALTVAATFTIPWMLMALGNPDTGALVTGYLGTLLLGAFFLAIGILFSGFFKDQIVAFVVTLLACFGIFLLGNDFIASYLDGVYEGLGTLLSQVVGMSDHYNSFTRGVVEVVDVAYFTAWTVVFLALNIMFIEGRSRPKARATFGVAVLLCVAIGLMVNWLMSSFSLIRWDATQDNIYTVSPASREILTSLTEPVTVHVYITEKAKMPTQLKTLEQSITDKLEELRVASSNRLKYQAIHMQVENVLAGKDDEEKEKDENKTEEKTVEERMLSKGIQPFSVRAMGGDEVVNKLIYSSVGVAYKDKKEEIITPVMPQNIDELEYRIVSTLFKVMRPKPPVIALVAPKDQLDPQMRAMLMQMGRDVPQDDPYDKVEQTLRMEKYDVQRVDLTQDSPMPEEYDAVVVINPRNFNDRQRWEVSRALYAGKPVIMAVQNYEWDYRPSNTGIKLTKKEEKPQVNDLLKAYGFAVSEEILMDVNKVPLTVSSGNPIEQLMGGGQQVTLPLHVLVNSDSMDTSVSITNRLSNVFYLWGSPVSVDQEIVKKHGLDVKTLMTSSKQAWTVPGSQTLTRENLAQPAGEGSKYPLMILASGQFPDAFKDKPRPAWPQEPQMPNQPPKPPKPEEGEAKPVTAAPGKLILLGCSEPFRKNFLQAGNLDLLMNSVDALTLGEQLVNVRSRKPVDRTIETPKPAIKATWKAINYSLATLIIAGAGIMSTLYRRRSRNAYTMAYGATED